MQAATIMTIPEDSYSVGGRATPMDAKINNHMACPTMTCQSHARRNCGGCRNPTDLPDSPVEQRGPPTDPFEPPESRNGTDHIDLI